MSGWQRGSVEVHRVRYHRNGVGGADFFLVELTDHDTGEDFPARLVASVWVDEDPETGEVSKVTQLDGGPGDYLISVVDVDNLSAHWRGDVYADVLIEAIREAALTLATYGADS